MKMYIINSRNDNEFTKLNVMIRSDGETRKKKENNKATPQQIMDQGHSPSLEAFVEENLTCSRQD